MPVINLSTKDMENIELCASIVGFHVRACDQEGWKHSATALASVARLLEKLHSRAASPQKAVHGVIPE